MPEAERSPPNRTGLSGELSRRADESGTASKRRVGKRERARATIVPPEVLEATARRLRVLGHPLRLRVLELLAGGPRSVSDLARLLGVDHDLVSKHLSALLRVGVVARRQEGNFALYSLPDALTIKAVALIGRGVADNRVRLARHAAGDQADSEDGARS